MKLLEGLIETKLLALILAFFKNPEKLYNLTELSKTTKVPAATIMRLVQNLVKNDLVEQINVGRMKIYRLAKNEKIKKLEVLCKDE